MDSDPFAYIIIGWRSEKKVRIIVSRNHCNKRLAMSNRKLITANKFCDNKQCKDYGRTDKENIKGFGHSPNSIVYYLGFPYSFIFLYRVAFDTPKISDALVRFLGKLSNM